MLPEHLPNKCNIRYGERLEISGYEAQLFSKVEIGSKHFSFSPIASQLSIGFKYLHMRMYITIVVFASCQMTQATSRVTKFQMLLFLMTIKRCAI
jgi:hypothetical protein